MCGRKLLVPSNNDMPLDTVIKIIDRMPRRGYQIDFTGWGEPLMHPGIFEAVRYAKKRGFTTMFATNGLLLNQEVRREILRSRHDAVVFSVDSISDHGDDPFWRGHPYHHEVLDNIRLLLAERGDSPLRVMLLCMIIKPELDGYFQIIRFAKEVGIDVVLLERLLRMHDPDLPRPAFSDEKRVFVESFKLGTAIGQKVVSVFSYKRGLRRAFYRFGRFCPISYRGAYIDNQGNVTPCCNLPRLVMGNILEQELEDIWNNRQFKFFRKSHPLRYCRSCDYVRPYDRC